MTTKVRLFVAGIALATLAGLMCLSNESFAGSDKDRKSNLAKIADAFKKGDMDGAKKLAAKAVKDTNLIEDMADIMRMFSKTNEKDAAKGGLNLEKRLKKPALEEAEELGNLTAAVAELSLAHGWPNPSGKRSKKAWTEYSEQLRDASLNLAKVKSADALKKAATKVNNSCVGCHAIFKTS